MPHQHGRPDEHAEILGPTTRTAQESYDVGHRMGLEALRVLRPYEVARIRDGHADEVAHARHDYSYWSSLGWLDATDAE